MRNFVLMIRATHIVVVSAIIVAALTLGTRGAYCDPSLSTLLRSDQSAQNNAANIKKIYVPELVRMIHDKTPGLVILDANGEGTRAKFGVIPGSRLLSSADGYDVATELPANKNAVLVFYCADRHWNASDEAARRAAAAGYKNLYEMKDGIIGWDAAKQPSVPLSSYHQSTAGWAVQPMAVESDATASAAILLVCCAASNEANAEKWEQHKSGIAETKAIAKEGFIHGLPIAVSYPVTYE